MIEETIKNTISRYINKFGHNEKLLSKKLSRYFNVLELESDIDKNKFDKLVQDESSELKNFNNIVEQLPRICPIEKIINYDYSSDDDWENFIEGVNCKIDLFNKKFYNTDNLGDDFAAEIWKQQHPEIYKYSVWVVANFGDKDNTYYNAFTRETNHLIPRLTKDKRKEYKKKRDERLRLELWIYDFRVNCVLQNIFLYDYIEKLSQDEFTSRFNKGLYEYVNNKIQLVKAQDRSAQSSKWQEILDEILDWFVEKNINYKKVQPLFEMKITQDDLKKQKKPKGKGGRPPDPKLEKKKRSLNKDYYNLREKEGFTKSKTMDILKKKYPWTKSTIETYLK